MREYNPIVAADEPCCWTADDFSDLAQHKHQLTRSMIDEVTSTAKSALASSLPHYKWQKHDFNLPETTSMLQAAYRDVEDGVGFSIISGWPVDTHDYNMNIAAYGVIASHLGEIKIQNYEGDWLVDVVDTNKPYSYTSRGYQSAELLPFHSDGADISGLLGLGKAARGGETILVSAVSLFKTIAKEHPNLMPILERGYYHHRRRQHPKGENPLSAHRIPVFAFYNQLLHCCYNRNPIEWVYHEGMKLSDIEVEALDAIDAICARPEMQISITVQKGEMLFFNNFTALHSRTAFEDDANNKRHLVRVWLENPKSKRLGETLLDLYVPGTSRYEAQEA